MKNKLGYFLFFYAFLFFAFGLNADALELKNTTSNCTLSKSECSNTANCIYIESKQCGIIATENINYTCYYKYYNNPSTVFLKATFNRNGIVSVEVDHDIPNVSKILGKTHEKKEPIKFTTRNERITYYTCPASIIEYKVENVDVNGIATTLRYYTPIVYELTDHNIIYSLLEAENYNDVMAILPKNVETLPETETKSPLECTYYYEKDSVKVSLVVTYADQNTITVSELISANSGNSSGLEFDTTYIKQSDEFKNWQCSSKNEVYVVSDGKKKYISYNKDDLKEISEYINTLEGTNSSQPLPDGDINNGKPLYKCDEIIPPEIRNWINGALNLLKYIALVLVIVLGVTDFIKAAASGEADQMKKSGQSFLKRIIAVIILFLLPMLIELILNLIDIYGANSTCI